MAIRDAHAKVYLAVMVTEAAVLHWLGSSYNREIEKESYEEES